MAGGSRPGAGRKKGVPNKVTQETKEVIALVAEGLGGAEAMLTWARKNEDAFWERIYPKLLPLTLTGDKNNPVRQVHEFVTRFESNI